MYSHLFCLSLSQYIFVMIIIFNIYFLNIFLIFLIFDRFHVGSPHHAYMITSCGCTAPSGGRRYSVLMMRGDKIYARRTQYLYRRVLYCTVLYFTVCKTEYMHTVYSIVCYTVYYCICHSTAVLCVIIVLPVVLCCWYVQYQGHLPFTVHSILQKGVRHTEQ